MGDKSKHHESLCSLEDEGDMTQHQCEPPPNHQLQTPCPAKTDHEFASSHLEPATAYHGFQQEIHPYREAGDQLQPLGQNPVDMSARWGALGHKLSERVMPSERTDKKY